MSDVWRIFVVEGDETLNQSLVNSLRKDGYVAQGVTTGVDAVRVLWSEEFDLVICDLKTPGADGFELLQWLRAYRTNTQMILVGEANSTATLRMQALESGAVSYLEKPLDYRVLREELRRLLQQTGFSASLDSFDLLDVIQIITMSRKSITLLVNTGLEERGVLCFQNGELTWAEYGVLRGEEAFFALAAHKNGTVIHQPGTSHTATNVTQPLSRLIFQALQYRTKYANQQQYSGELETLQAQGHVSTVSPLFSDTDEIDDTPFVFGGPDSQPSLQSMPTPPPIQRPSESKEWWELTEHTPSVKPANDQDAAVAPTMAIDRNALNTMINGLKQQATAEETQLPFQQPTELPAWLIDQPTDPKMPAAKSNTNAQAMSMPTIPATPPAVGQTAGEFLRPSSPDWNASQRTPPAIDFGQSGPLYYEQQLVEDSPILSSSVLQAQRAARQNHATLISTLQSLGYALPSFIAAGLLTMDGHTIAQVAVDTTDFTKIGKAMSTVQRSIFLALEQGALGEFEEMQISSGERSLFLRIIGRERRVLLAMITTRDVNTVECLHMMMNVEGAIIAALQ